MKQDQVARALEVGREDATRNLLDRCSFARGVRAFLIELEKGASWWEKIVIGVVRGLVSRTIGECEASNPLGRL